MPIKPENKALYPKDWKTRIRPEILKRANNCCEFCKVENHSEVQRAESITVKIVLTIAHLDHDPTNNDYSNLRALCQRCHNRYDAEHRKANRAATCLAKKFPNQNSLF